MAALHCKSLSPTDIDTIVAAFTAIGWHKPASTFEKYFAEQEKGERSVWVAFENKTFLGYVTLKWLSGYPDFIDNNIPEISDLNVLPQFQKQGIGSLLLEQAETAARKSHTHIGLGVGLSADYGAAQRLYVKRGYVPDGKGVFYQNDNPYPASLKGLDDHFVLWLLKAL